MLHQSLCSATGIPHSTHTRTRTLGSAFFENSFWKIVIVTQTDNPARRFAEIGYLSVKSPANSLTTSEYGPFPFQRTDRNRPPVDWLNGCAQMSQMGRAHV